MSAVLSLERTCILHVVRSLLEVRSPHLRDPGWRDACDLRRRIASERSNLTALEQLLAHLVENYPRSVTDELLGVLIPLHLKTLNLSKCRFALQDTARYDALLPRLGDVRSLVLDKSLQADPVPDCFAEQLTRGLPNLTSVSLQDCPGVTDSFVSILLFGVTNLTHLNLARSGRITDEAFYNRSGGAPPGLESLDVSGCSGLTNTAIRLLTELCGSSLRHVNVAACNMDCTILWYLAGHSLSSSAQLASGVVGDIGSVQQALSSHMNRLLHEYQFISDKLRGALARLEAARDCEGGNADGDMSMDGIEGGAVEGDVGGGDSDTNMDNAAVAVRASDEEASEETAVKNGAHAEAEPPPLMCEKPPMQCHGKEVQNRNCGDDRGVQPLDSESDSTLASGSGTRQTTMESGDNTGEGAGIRLPVGTPTDSSKRTLSTEEQNKRHLDLSDDDRGTQNVDMDDGNEMPSSSEDGAGLRCKCLHNSTEAHSPKRLFQPGLLSLDMSRIEFDPSLVWSCFDEFFSANRGLRSLTVTNSKLTDALLEVVGDKCTDLSHLSLTECSEISSEGLAYLLSRCKRLKNLCIQGAPFLSHTAFQPIMESETPLEVLHVAEMRINDGILHQLPRVVGHTLKELNLNWCDDITSSGILSMIQNCPHLETFSVRQFSFKEDTLRILAENCPRMKQLDLSGSEEMTDMILLEIIPHFRLLKVLDISWTLNPTNTGVGVVLASCPLLTDLTLSGSKRIDEKPFVPIISDYNRWKRCQSLIRLKLHEQRLRERTGQLSFSSDEEYEDLCVPLRSTSYAPLLQRLDLQYCDLVKDKILAEIVAVCCGSLRIIDYYGSRVEPKLLSL